MLDFEGMLQDKYLFFFYNALTINYYKTDLDKAIKHLEEMRLNEKIGDVLLRIVHRHEHGLLYGGGGQP
ncbi:MAG: hypothetical protein U0176_20835 [Bacteroidia bacterium]